MLERIKKWFEMFNKKNMECCKKLHILPYD